MTYGYLVINLKMTLKITIADAMLEHNTEVGGLMRPYVIVHTRDSQFKTRPSSGRNPSWGDSVLVSEREEDLTIEIFDSERGMDDTIGHAFIKIRSLIGQPYVPEERVVSLMYQHHHAGEIRLIVEYIEGKEHVGGLAPFQSKLIMNDQRMQGQQVQQSQQFQQPPYGMSGSIIQQVTPPLQSYPAISQNNTNYSRVPPLMPADMGSIVYTPMMNTSVVQQQPILNTRFSGGNYFPNQIQVTTIDEQPPIAQRPMMTNTIVSDPGMFNSYQPGGMDPRMAANSSIPGGSPSLINQAFGTRRVPIFKGGYPSLNWFSLLDSKGLPVEFMPPRLI